MKTIIKQLPAKKVFTAIAFLMMQTFCALYLPYLTANIVNHGIVTGDTAYIWQQGGVMLLMTVLSLVGAVLNTYISAKIAYDLGRDLRSSIYQRVLGFSNSDYDKFGASTLITRNTNDVTQVQNVIEMGLKFLILSPLYLIGGIGMTFLLSPKLGVILMASIPLMAIATYILYRCANPLYERMQKLLDHLNLYFREGLTGVRVIRAFSKEEEDYLKYQQTNGQYTQTAITAGTIMSVFIPVITLLLNLCTLFIVWVGARDVAAGSIAVGAIIGALSYATQILMGFAILTSVILALPRGQISAKRIMEVLDTPLALSDPDKPLAIAADSLQFNQVDFRYPGANKKTLEDIELSVHKGQTLAIIGSTGDGKSSLVNLISRMYDVEKGAVKIGGIDVRQFSQNALRDQISFAPQKSTLFKGSIRDNLQIAKPDATDAQMWAALDIANASEFVSELKNGLDGVVLKAGGNFSGGQKQRLCIARTILKDASIYIFDDSFSALDFKTDAAVRQSMKAKLTDAITVIIAQRISSIQDADVIAVLDDGKLAGVGTHQQLLANNEIYQQILDAQTYKEAVA